MQYPDPQFWVLALAALIYLVLFAIILRTRSMRETRMALLQVFLLAVTTWSVTQAMLRAIQLDQLAGYDSGVLERMGMYLVVVIAALFYALTCRFEQRGRRELYGWISAGLFLTTGVILSENFLNLPDYLMRAFGLVMVRSLAADAVLVCGWGYFMASALIITIGAYHRAATPLHKNRNKYWSLAVALLALGQAFVISRLPLPGAVFQLLAVIAAAFVLLTFNLPDLRLAVRRAGAYFVILILTIALYTGLLYAALLLLPQTLFLPVGIAAIAAAALALALNPLIIVIQRFIRHWISGSPYDPSQTLSEYSKSISNILDMDLLASAVIGLVSEVMGVTQGALITVSSESEADPNDENSASFRLHPIGGMGQVMPDGRLAARNPVAYYLRREQQPLTQYDIDLLPRFQEMDEEERAWINSLKMDVYVPIYAKEQWIGVLALGHKGSGDRYFKEDLVVLKTLADQTAVALENARLFQNLKDRNAENERLNQELKSANQELARLDLAKSDFINIASHELRTPLTQVIGYNDILAEMLANENLQPEIGQQMTGNVRRAARRLEEIVDTMFDVSKLDTHTLDLMHAPVSLAAVISLVVDSWHTSLEERSQTIVVRGLANLPTLMADAKRLAQVFSQLIQNAIKSTPDGGQIRITGRCVEDDNNEFSIIEVTVADTGIGIAAEDLERIFDKFYRVGNVLLHSTGSAKFKGAGPGLGLTIARGIINAHGGRIWAESPGHDEETCPGAKFHILLPVRKIEEVYGKPPNGSVKVL